MMLKMKILKGKKIMAKKSVSSKLDAIADKYNKKSPGTVITLNEEPIEVERLSTGILTLDYALGGGVVKGKHTVFSGAESSGKSGVAMKVVSEAQKYGVVIYMDAEDTLDPRIIENSDVDVEALRIVYPNSGEEAFSMIDDYVRSNEVSLIVVDSTSYLTPQAILAGDYGDGNVAGQPRMFSQGFSKLAEAYRDSDSKTAIIWISQLREKIGGMSYGPKTDLPGGRALKHALSTHVQFVRTGRVKEKIDGEEVVVGQDVLATVAKSKFSPPFRKAEFTIMYDTGISDTSSFITIGIKLGRFVKDEKGAWYTDTVTGERFQGKPKINQALEENEEFFAEVEAWVKENIAN